MTDKNNGSLSTVLKDVDPDHRGSLAVRVVANESAVSIFPEGYGDFGMPRGTDAPSSWNFTRAGSGSSSSATSIGKTPRTSSTSKGRKNIDGLKT